MAYIDGLSDCLSHATMRTSGRYECSAVTDRTLEPSMYTDLTDECEARALPAFQGIEPVAPAALGKWVT